METLRWLSSLTYDLGPIALLIPPEHKPVVAQVAALATLALSLLAAWGLKGRDVTGGTVKQGHDGGVIATSNFDLGNLPEYFEYYDDAGTLVRKPTREATPAQLVAIKKAVISHLIPP
jgi:hypothetical protein